MSFSSHLGSDSMSTFLTSVAHMTNSERLLQRTTTAVSQRLNRAPRSAAPSAHAPALGAQLNAAASAGKRGAGAAPGPHPSMSDSRTTPYLPNASVLAPVACAPRTR